MRGLRIAGASLAAECGLWWGTWASVVVTLEQGLRRLGAQGVAAPLCGILVPGPGIEPVTPALAGGRLTTGPPGQSLASL